MAPRDISKLPLKDALRTNPRKLNIRDMQRLLLEAADRIETLERHIAEVGSTVPTEEELV